MFLMTMETPKIAKNVWYLFSLCCVLISAAWALDFVYVNSEGMFNSEIWAMFVVLTLIMGFSMIILHWRRIPPILYLQNAIKTLKQNNALLPKAVRTIILFTLILGFVLPLVLCIGFFVVILPGELWDRGVFGLLIGLMVLLPNLPGTYHSALQGLMKPHLKEEEKTYAKTFFAKWSDYVIFAIGVVGALALFYIVKGL